MFSVPFRLSLTELISSTDISGTAPLSDVLKTVILEEFIITLWITMVFDEMDMSCMGSVIPSSVSLHCKANSVELHVTANLSPAWQTLALGEGFITTTPISIILCYSYSKARGMSVSILHTKQGIDQ